MHMQISRAVALCCMVATLAGCSLLRSQENAHPTTIQELVSRYVAANNVQDAKA